MVGEGLWGPQGRVPRPDCVALPRLLAVPGTSQPLASRASGLRQEGALRLHRLGSGRQTRAAASILFPAQLGLWWWWGSNVRKDMSACHPFLTLSKTGNPVEMGVPRPPDPRGRTWTEEVKGTGVNVRRTLGAGRLQDTQ